jgi:hypothetical protein
VDESVLFLERGLSMECSSALKRFITSPYLNLVGVVSLGSWCLIFCCSLFGSVGS